MIQSFPDHHLNNIVCGVSTPARGIAAGVYVDSTYHESGEFAVRWDSLRLANIDLEHTAFLKTLNDINLECVVGATQTLFPLLTTEQCAEIGILPLTFWEKDLISSNLFTINDFGSRVLLFWEDVPTAEDFYAYELWWNEGAGAIDTLLATLIGEQNREYGTTSLDEGTYQFRLRYLDRVGNLSANTGTYVEITTRPVPLALENVQASYSQETRKVTITWTVPGSQISSVVGATIYDNFIAGVDFGTQPNLDKKYRRAFISSGTLTWTSNELFEGVWRFCVRAVSDNGLESDYIVLALKLVKVGSDLISKTLPPVRPYFIDARAEAAAHITVTVKHSNVNMTGIKLYVDDVYDSLIVKNSSGIYTFDFTGSDATEYEFKACAYNADGNGDFGDTVVETADSSAPSGDQVITAELTV